VGKGKAMDSDELSACGKKKQESGVEAKIKDRKFRKRKGRRIKKGTEPVKTTPIEPM